MAHRDFCHRGDAAAKSRGHFPIGWRDGAFLICNFVRPLQLRARTPSLVERNCPPSCGIPLALFVLLQDYRFLLLDAFLRFVVNASLAAAALLISIRIVESPDFAQHLQHPFDAGLLFVSACLLLTLFVYIRNRIQAWLTQVIFLRSSVEDAFKSCGTGPCHPCRNPNTSDMPPS